MKNRSPSKPVTRATVIKTFAILLAVAFGLRIFYAGHLFQDDGLWFTAAEELLRGKALYSEIYFDKPPLLPLLYALLFKLFGVHILTIRLFTIFYSVAVAFVLYRFGALLFDQRQGLLAGAMFVVFSTTYTTGHFQGLNTDFLMTLPYTLGAYLFVSAKIDGQRSQSRRIWFLFASGVAVGLAFQTNPKALFNLLFFALVSWFGVRGRRDPELRTPHSGLRTVLGFLVGALPFWVYVAATGSLNEYIASVWQWGARYAAYYSIGDSVIAAIRQSFGYFALNPILLMGLVFLVWSAIRGFRGRQQGASKPATGADLAVNSDLLLLLWFAVSYAGMSVGGRFFGHYFFQILPGLCLIGARAVMGILESLAAQPHRRRLVIALLLAGVTVTLARFHTRTTRLAVDWAQGVKSEMTREWFHERLKYEERLVAATVKDMLKEALKDAPEEAAAIEQLGAEELRHRSPEKGADGGSEDYLFVWGYRPEIYFWSGLRPASRFLSTQPLTGVPADVHYFDQTYLAVLDEQTTAAYRQQLLRDLQANPPRYIVDELGFFNDNLAINAYPELQGFLEDYRYWEARGRFLIYFRRAPKEKKNKSPALQ